MHAFIGLGSNEGDRVGYIQQAMQLLKDISQIEVVECSSLYETEPVDDLQTEWFVNGVAHLQTQLTAEELQDVLKDIEARLDSVRERKNCLSDSSRKINLDILFYDDQVVESPYLTVPHPYLHKRAYALVPLLEIAPDLVHPSLKKTVTELHEALPEPELVFLYGTRGVEHDL